jgi:hypothetical protein
MYAAAITTSSLTTITNKNENEDDAVLGLVWASVCTPSQQTNELPTHVFYPTKCDSFTNIFLLSYPLPKFM